MTKVERLLARRDAIIKASLGLDYAPYEQDGIGFDYEAMMSDVNLSLQEIKDLQNDHMVGHTPLLELKRLTAYARQFAPKGHGARLFLKDEAANLSGSFKARRAAISVYLAKKLGYKGVIAATSGNYGAAVAALAARYGLKCIIVQECFDSQGIGQPEILEKARACEAYGAEVVQLSVGPELFVEFLSLLEETNYFNASLYSPHGVTGIETLGVEIAEEILKRENKYPEVVMCTHAGGGNVTGTARGLLKAGAKDTQIIGVSVDLHGLHMASDHDFNKKSFTTGHTGFGIPFATYPDRSDVPRSAARPLRYMDRYFLVNQGSVFFMTEALALCEGLERGPAGNTALAAAFAYAKTLKDDAIIVIQETEYTGAGKHMSAQCSFAKDNGITLKFGNPSDEIPGKDIIFPQSGRDVSYKEIEMNQLRRTYLRRFKGTMLSPHDQLYLRQELKINETELNTLWMEVEDETKSR